MSEQKQPQRWYIVADKKDGASCLVEASNKAQAYRRAGEFYCRARPATVDEALRMARDGRDVIYAPNEPEQLDLTDSVVTGATSPASVKEGSDPEASEPSDASGPLKCDGNHCGPPCADPECWAREPPELPKVTGIVPEAARGGFCEHGVPRGERCLGCDDLTTASHKSPAPKPRKASDVFGAGFGPRDEPDVG